MVDTTWTNGGGDGKASTAANWSNGIDVGYNVIFDGTSTANCTFDYDGELGTFTIAAGYSGTITQSSDMYISGFSMAGGVFSGVTTKWVYLSGNLTKTGGAFTTDKTNLDILGVTDYTSDTLVQIYNLTVHGTFTSLASSPMGLYCNRAMVIHPGAEVVCNKVIAWNYGVSFDNQGLISGPANLEIRLYDQNETINVGNCNVPLLFFLYSTAAASRSVAITADITNLKTVQIYSIHATYTCTLDLAGFDLTASTITLGDRGILTDSVGGSVITGNVTVNGTDAVLTQGAGKAITITGDLTLTLGTITQLGDITLNGNYAQGGGTLTGSTSYWFYCSGNFIKTAGTLTANKVRLNMSGTGKTLTVSDQLNALTVSGSVTSSAIDIAYSLVVSGSLDSANSILLNYNNGGTYSNTGTINSATNFSVQSFSTSPNRNFTPGTINGKLRFILPNFSPTANCKITLLGDLSGNSEVSVVSANATYTMTLDINGHALTATALTVSTRGILTNGAATPSVIRCASLDSSAGTFTPDRTVLVMEGASTIKLAAGGTVNSLISKGVTTLASNVTVSDVCAHVNPITKGAFALTLTKPENEYTGLRRPIIIPVKKLDIGPVRLADEWLRDLGAVI